MIKTITGPAGVVGKGFRLQVDLILASCIVNRLTDMLLEDSQKLQEWAKVIAEECASTADVNVHKGECHVCCSPPTNKLREFVEWIMMEENE